MHPGRFVLLRIRVVAAALAMLACAGIAAAGEFFEHDGVAIRGYDPVAYFTEGKPVRGSPDIKAEYKGSTFHFSSKAHRDAFVADAAKFAPQYGGFCAFGVAGGYKAATQPAAFTVIDDKLYLNYNRDIHRQWSGDIPGYVKSADRKWPDVSRQTKVVQ
jgi:YHS domain-containing protein